MTTMSNANNANYINCQQRRLCWMPTTPTMSTANYANCVDCQQRQLCRMPTTPTMLNANNVEYADCQPHQLCRLPTTPTMPNANNANYVECQQRQLCQSCQLCWPLCPHSQLKARRAATAQPVHEKSDQGFKWSHTILYASIASDRGGNERAANLARYVVWSKGDSRCAWMFQDIAIRW